MFPIETIQDSLSSKSISSQNDHVCYFQEVIQYKLYCSTTVQTFTHKGLQYIIKYDYIVELSVTVTFELDQLDPFIRPKSGLHLFQEYPILKYF